MSDNVLPAKTIGLRFGRYSRGVWHLCDLPEAPGPWRRSTDYTTRCGRDGEGRSPCHVDPAQLEQHQIPVCKRCKAHQRP